MDDFKKIVEKYVTEPSEKKYLSLGKTYSINDDYYDGHYWYYEAKDFMIDIHDFYIKKEVIDENIPNMDAYALLYSKYLISGSGELFNPYQTMEPNSMFIMDTTKPSDKYILHGGSRYFMVGMMFKKSMLEKYIIQNKVTKLNDISKIFIETKDSVVKPISKLAYEILNCKMKGVSLEIFLEAKAKEWLSITIDAYENRRKNQHISHYDKEAIEMVASYINDHYAFDIPQEFLEKISSMSGTKLKKSFKSIYNMSITEYTQRKRMNIAENLLLSTDLKISSIAKTVGYNSPSRFSSLYKRYKGTYPKESRKKSE